MSNDFYDRTLISLKRQYSKDEVVAALTKKLSESEVKNGQLLDEIEDLKEQLKILESQISVDKEVNKAAKIECRKEQLYVMKVEEIKKQREKIKSLKRHRDDLIAQLNKKS